MHCDRCGRDTSDVGISPGTNGPVALCVECQHPDDDPHLANLRTLNDRFRSLASAVDSWHLTTNKTLDAVQGAIAHLDHTATERNADRPSWLFWSGIVAGIAGTLLFRACLG